VVPLGSGRLSRAGLALVALGVLAVAAPVVAQAPVSPAPVVSPGPASTPAPSGPLELPSDLEPSLEDAPLVRPRAYEDGCHAKAGQRRAKPCAYGDPDGVYSVLLIGDSHAVQWLPALEAMADREGWRLYSLTKSACPVPDTPVIVRGDRLRDCPPWRDAAFRSVADLHPDLVLAAWLGSIYELRGARSADARDRAWRRAWVRSLETLRDAAGRVALLGDTPMWQQDPLVCLPRHSHDIGRCDTPRRKAVSARTEAIERAAAAQADVAYVPTADLVCPDDPCRAVVGRTLVLGDVQHMTVAWARSIAPRLLRRLTCDMPPGAVALVPPDASSSPGTTVQPGSAAPSSPGASSVAPSGAPDASPPVSCPS
jgi:hypothetical protein